jgi:NADPH-dependent stearoyl-CoA 9-desaturase
MRIDPHQKWHPVYLFQPLYNILLMTFFEWGVATHDLDFEAIKAGEKSKEEVNRQLKGMAGKARDQIVKDYIAFPVLSGLLGIGFDAALAALGVDRAKPEPASRVKRTALRARRKLERSKPRTTGSVIAELVERRSFRAPFYGTLKANFTANIIRNVWAHAIIFCGHFPDQTYTFSQAETEDESRGERYVRQLLGAANIEGGPMFHVMSGNLGYQVEHHLYPDMPSTRYGEIAPRVREICERYELPYNSGPFGRQLWSVHRTIARLAFPGGKPRPKPGPYHEPVTNSGERGPGSVNGSDGASTNGAPTAE